MSAFAELDSTHVDAADGLLGEDLGIGTDDFGEEAADGAVEKEGGARGFANAMSQILSKTIPKARSKVRHTIVSELCVCVWPGGGVSTLLWPVFGTLRIYESGECLGTVPTGGVELYGIRWSLVPMVRCCAGR